MKFIAKKLALALVLLSPNLAHAQSGGHVGGGDPTASDFQDFINEIDAYLLTDEGKAAFPELKQPEFHHIITRVKPVVKDERVYDSFGVAQACVSYKSATDRYFQCDVKRLPQLELNNQPTFYRITFHELLFQAGLELPKSKTIPSDFSISSRLKLTLKTYQKWVPGSTPVVAQKVSKTPCQAPNPDAVTLFRIIDSSATDKLAQIKSFFAKGHIVAVDAKNENCENPLLHSIRIHEYDVFDLLYAIYRKPNINRVYQLAGDHRATLYAYALMHGNDHFISKLKSMGASSRWEGGRTDLMIAAAHNSDVKVIRALIQARAAINRADVSGATALMYAALNNNHVGVIKVLLQAGAEVNHADEEGATALMWAVTRNHIDVIKVLLRGGAAVNQANEEGGTALILAAENNRGVDVIQALIEAGAEIDHAYKDHTYYKGGFTALMSAAKSNSNVDVIRALIAAGAAVDRADTTVYGATALMYAAESNANIDVAKALIAAGADVNRGDQWGKTALMYAAESNSNVKMTQTFIEAGTDVNRVTQWGYTALMYAAESNSNVDVIKALIAARANVNHVNKYNERTVLLYARDNPNPAVAQEIIKAGGHY